MLPEVFASPIPGGGFVFCGIAVMSCPEVLPTGRIFMLSKVFVVTVPVGHLLDLVSFFAEDDELLLRFLRGAFRFVESRIGLSAILDTARG